MLHRQHIQILLIVALSLGCFGGCGFMGFATTKWMNRRDLPEDIRAESGEELSDTYYGLLVYLEQMDEPLPLAAKTRFVRAHYRQAGQKRANGKAWINRLQNFGRRLRTVMSEDERNKFVELLDEGYYFQVQLKKDIGGVQWRSTKGVYLEGSEPLPNSPTPEKSRKQDDPPLPKEENLALPLAATAELLALNDETIVHAVANQLCETPVDREYQDAIAAALAKNVIAGRPMKSKEHHKEYDIKPNRNRIGKQNQWRHSHSQFAALLHWLTPTQASNVALQLSEQEFRKRNQMAMLTDILYEYFELDAAGAFEWVDQHAKTDRVFECLARAARYRTDHAWAETLTITLLANDNLLAMQRSGELIQDHYPHLAKRCAERFFASGEPTLENMIAAIVANSDGATIDWFVMRTLKTRLAQLQSSDVQRNQAAGEEARQRHLAGMGFKLVAKLPKERQIVVARTAATDTELLVSNQSLLTAASTLPANEREQVLMQSLASKDMARRSVPALLPDLSLEARIRVAEKAIQLDDRTVTEHSLRAIQDAPADVRSRIAVAVSKSGRAGLDQVLSVIQPKSDRESIDFLLNLIQNNPDNRNGLLGRKVAELAAKLSQDQQAEVISAMIAKGDREMIRSGIEMAIKLPLPLGGPLVMKVLQQDYHSHARLAWLQFQRMPAEYRKMATEAIASGKVRPPYAELRRVVDGVSGELKIKILAVALRDDQCAKYVTRHLTRISPQEKIVIAESALPSDVYDGVKTAAKILSQHGTAKHIALLEKSRKSSSSTNDRRINYEIDKAIEAIRKRSSTRESIDGTQPK